MIESESLRTPLGPIRILLDGSGAVTRISWIGSAEEAGDPGDDPGAPLAEPRTIAGRQIAEYFGGERTGFSLELAPVGTPFQIRVWRALREIPFGEAWSYSRLAAAVDSHPRAVGGANRANPLPIVVPCHRVIGAGGALTGYSAGLARKEWLLRHEAVRE